MLLFVSRFRHTPDAEQHEAPTTGKTVPLGDLQAALDARNWAARPDRVEVLRKALSEAPASVLAAASRSRC